MPLTRRLIAALTSALLLQLTLLASGTVCPMRGGSGSAMAAHGHHAAHTATAHVVAQADVPPSHQCDTVPARNGCDGPAGMDNCASMTTCTASVVAPAAVVVASMTVSHAASDLLEPGRIVSGPAFAPELPPPRA